MSEFLYYFIYDVLQVFFWTFMILLPWELVRKFILK